MSAPPRILILGGSGQVGTELRRSFAGFGEILVVHRDALDLSKPPQIRDAVRRARPDVILNAAAYTAVDRAESEPGLAAAVNADAPGVLAEEAAAANALLVHYSTDYVFDGSKSEPWTESDTPRPLNVYGTTKLAGERAILRAGGRHLIFRTSWVYGPHGRNFLLTMLRLGRERDRLSIVDDQFGAPTSSIAIADATRSVVESALSGRCGEPSEWSGIYHMSCSGSTTWYGFTQAIFDRTRDLFSARAPEVVAIPTSSYPTPAQRPRNSVLSNANLDRRFGIRLLPWEVALDTVIAALPAP